MRAFAFVLASVALSFAAGCASQAAEPAKLPEPIAYDRADYMPPSEFEMKIDTTGSTFDAPAVKAPTATTFAPRLVSLEKNAK